MRSRSLLIPIAVFCCYHALPAQLPDQTEKRDAFIVLFVVDTNSRPIPLVEVTLVGEGATRLSDSTGRAVFVALNPGSYQLRLRRLGFQETSLTLQVPYGKRVEAHGSMRPVAQVLPTVVQVDTAFKPARYARTTKFDDFYRRRAGKAGGTFITRDDIDRRQPGRSMDLFYNVPGVSLTWSAAYPHLSFARCKYGNIAVFIDGLPAQEGIELIAALHPNQIEAIEIYHGLATAPPQFVPKPNDCAAIVVWTKY